jgi:hypothetical protein
MSSDLTICSVSFESREWLRLNRRLLDRLNPGSHVRWVVAENSPPGSAHRLRDGEPGFEVVPGAAFEVHAQGSASYHHAAGLERTLRDVRSRFLLVLDPDFLIVRPAWISDVMEHVRASGIALFGAPWHPSRPRKYRYFPCAHCILVDLERVPLAALDFAPDLESAPRRTERGLLDRVVPLDLAPRRQIAQSRDTGWRLFERFGADPRARAECLQPVFLLGSLRRLLEWPLPDDRSLVPKRPGYFRTSGFAKAGLPDLASLGWEEYFWREQPFGAHARCHPIRLKNPEALGVHFAHAQRLVRRIAA